MSEPSKSRRKPLPENCNGSVECPVEGHVTYRGGGHVRWRIAHIPLTRGQQKTLDERWDAAHAE